MAFFEFDTYYIDAIQEKHAWRLCDFVTINTDRLQRYFPKTLQQNLTPDLSQLFVEKKVKEFNAKKEFLFVLKEKENHTLIGLVYVKELNWEEKQAELAYCIDYKVEGKGYTTQAIHKISEWAFNEHGFKTLQIIAHHTNLGSVKVAQKCGYTWQKTLENEHTPPGENPLDMELYERYR